jgi:hypothetical protein
VSEQIDPFDPTGQEAVAAQDAETQRLAREQEINDFRALMGTKEGRRFMWRLLSKTGVHRTSFSNDALVMAFNEGNRNLGLLLMSEIHGLCPARYQQMQKEHQENERRSKPKRS